MLRDSFCSSPWIHVRLRYDGSFRVCRWSKESNTEYNIRTHSIRDFYNSDHMRNLRTDLLDGKKPKGCAGCYYEDSFNKLSGRRRQLLKSAVSIDDFTLSMRSSPHYMMWRHSYSNNGHSNYQPVDLQIDLGNICNSACIMCSPEASSRLETEHNKLNKIEPDLFAKPKSYRSWTRDPEAVEKFVNEIAMFDKLKYIHFLGGETLYDPAFYDICDRLISAGLASKIIVGTTTNGTIYDERIERYIREFQQFHLGISIESVTDLNDYVRWPGKISTILTNTDRFCALRADTGLFISMRITPNIFTVHEIDLMIEYLLEKQVIAESCSILSSPSVLRMELLPDDIRQETITKLRAVINRHGLSKSSIVNVRDDNKITATIGDVANDYLMFLENYTVPEDLDAQRNNLVRYLKAFEKLHKNRITDHAPRYAEFLRHHGY